MLPPWTYVLIFLPYVFSMHWNTVEIKTKSVVLKENSTYWRDQAAKRRENYDYRDMNEEEEEEPSIPAVSLLRIFGIAFAMTQTIIIFLIMPEIYTDYIKTQEDDGANAIHLIDLPQMVVDKVRERKEEKEKEKTKEEEDISLTKKLSGEKKKKEKKGKKAKKHKKHKKGKKNKDKKEDDTIELYTAPDVGSWHKVLPDLPDNSPQQVRILGYSHERPPQSQRLPRAPKGNQDDFLAKMEMFLLEQDDDAPEDETHRKLEAKPAEKLEKNLTTQTTTERVHTAVEPTEEQSEMEKNDDDGKSSSNGA